MLTVTVQNLGEVAILRCRGRIVCGEESALLCSAAEARTAVVDLSEVEAIDAAGIGALVSLQAAGIYLKLIDPAPQVREVLKVTKVDSIFEICESQRTQILTEALAT